MSLIFCDSFDHYTNIGQKWSGAGGFITVGGARTGANSLVTSGLSAPSQGLAATSTVIVGCAVNPQGLNFDIHTLNGIFGLLCKASILINGAIQFGDIQGPKAVTAGGLVSTGAYCYIELKAIILSSSHGVASVALNGQIVLANINWVPNSGLTTFDNYIMEGPTGGLSANVDDFYLCDGNGTTNNDFLGPVRIYAVVPSNVGATTQFTPSVAQPNWQIVSVIPPNLVADVTGGAIGITDLYVFDPSAIPANSQIFAAQSCICAALDVAGARSVSADVAGNVSAQQNALTVTQTIYHTPYDKNPATASSWKLADFPNTQIGQQVTA